MRYLIILICNCFLLTTYGQNAVSLKMQLKGRWISEDDEKFQLVFNDTAKLDYYEGKLTSSYRYWIKQDSLIAKDLSDGYVYNYSIEGLSENHLTLMYLARGNFLMFRKKITTNRRLNKSGKN